MRMRSRKKDGKEKPEWRQKRDSARQALVETFPGWIWTAYPICRGRLDSCEYRDPLRWNLSTDEAP
jgi:hypothetical protein